VEITLRVDADKAVLALSGELVRGERLALLQEEVDALLREGCREIVIDLKSVSYVDSAGLGELLAISRNVQRDGTAVLRLAGLSKRLTDLFALTKLPPDLVDPTLPEVNWRIQASVALGIAVIIAILLWRVGGR
jgi:anti-anti-sigma factor